MIRYFLTVLRINIQKALSIKAAFISILLINIIKQASFLIAWDVFFDKYKTMNGWEFPDLLVMYGIVSLGRGITEMFLYGIKRVSTLIESNQLDVFLLQPKSLIFNIAFTKLELDSLGECIVGFLLIGYAGQLTNPLFWIVLPFAALFSFALYLYINALRFFIPNSNSLVQELLTSASIVTSQPNSAYRGMFKVFTMTLLPAAFISFFPVELLRTGLFEHWLWTALGTIGFFLGARALFYKGLKRYESGNYVVIRH
jgi:ABC-2 type transport system permease protein